MSLPAYYDDVVNEKLMAQCISMLEAAFSHVNTFATITCYHSLKGSFAEMPEYSGMKHNKNIEGTLITEY